MEVKEFEKTIKFEPLVSKDGKGRYMHKSYLTLLLKDGTYRNAYLYAIGKNTAFCKEDQALPEFKDCNVEESRKALIDMFLKMKEEKKWATKYETNHLAEPMDIKPMKKHIPQ